MLSVIACTFWSRVDAPSPNPGRLYHVSHDDVVHALARPRRARSKMDLPGWSPGEYRGGHRSLATLIALYACGVDVDGGATLAEVVAAWAGAWGYVHSTPSSSPSSPRWRVILFFREMLTDQQDMRRVTRWAQRRTPGQVDTKTIDPSRLWFLPWAGAAHWDHAGLDGDPLDAKAIAADERAREEAERAARVPRFAPTPATTGEYAHRALARACRAVAEAPPGTRNNMLAREAWSIGQLVGAGLLGEHEALGTIANVIADWPEPQKTHSTLERQIRDGATHPREVRRSPWG